MGRQICGEGLIKKTKANGILLSDHHVRQGRGKISAVIDLFYLRRRSIFHRPADIKQEIRLEVRFLFVLLDVVPVSPAEDLPVDVLDFIAPHVLAMLRELDTETMIGALMKAGNKTFDDEPGPELHVGESGNNVGKQISRGAFHY